MSCQVRLESVPFSKSGENARSKNKILRINKFLRDLNFRLENSWIYTHVDKITRHAFPQSFFCLNVIRVIIVKI